MPGDMNRWFFETVDMAKFLRKGDNFLAAVVWNFGIFRPSAQITFQTRFIVQGNSERERVVDTGPDKNWKSLDAEITLPKGLKGTFVYGKTSIVLKPGRQILKGIK